MEILETKSPLFFDLTVVDCVVERAFYSAVSNSGENGIKSSSYTVKIFEDREDLNSAVPLDFKNKIPNPKLIFTLIFLRITNSIISLLIPDNKAVTFSTVELLELAIVEILIVESFSSIND